METAGVASLGLIKVDIQGAVKQPGLYQLQTGQRLADLVAMAGGFSDGVDRAYAIKTLNLAKELKNQDKVYIPFFEEIVTESRGDAGGAAAGTTTESASNLISINQATASQLQGLTGIGEVKSQAIIDNRPYTSLDELVSKKVLSENLLNSLREQLGL